MTEPIDVYVITRGIMDKLYLLQRIKNICRAAEAVRKKRDAGWELILQDGVTLERMTVARDQEK
ncbi:MAG: hypothetical protein IJH95_00600 [Mogibacterium sp.]|nr:hypothetical protein [Mogibacterium sp.]